MEQADLRSGMICGQISGRNDQESFDVVKIFPRLMMLIWVVNVGETRA